MLFYPAHAPVPERLVTPDCVIRPLTKADCDRDLEAMRARPNVTSLTWEDNRRDLARHEQEHRDRLAFTYTVFDAADARCLGCVYITTVPEGAREHEHEGLASFWVRPDAADAAGLERRLFDALLPWLREAFAFDRVCFRPHWNETPEARARQAAMFTRAGLRHLFFAGDDIYG